jgi:hypothetical protein
MTLGNMRKLDVQHLIAFCPHDSCRHSALIDVLEDCILLISSLCNRVCFFQVTSPGHRGSFYFFFMLNRAELTNSVTDITAAPRALQYALMHRVFERRASHCR